MKIIIGPVICFIVLLFLASTVFIVLKKKYVQDTLKLSPYLSYRQCSHDFFFSPDKLKDRLAH